MLKWAEISVITYAATHVAGDHSVVNPSLAAPARPYYNNRHEI